MKGHRKAAGKGLPKSIGAHSMTSYSLDTRRGDPASSICSWRFQTCFGPISLHFRMGMFPSFVHHCILELCKFLFKIRGHTEVCLVGAAELGSAVAGTVALTEDLYLTPNTHMLAHNQL